jgi:tripartite-type tricarboxylate transporter receptor subunit TctC
VTGVQTCALPIYKLVAATHRALAAPEIKAKFAQQGAEVVTSTPAELAAKLEADLKVWAEIVKASGARIE